MDLSTFNSLAEALEQHLSATVRTTIQTYNQKMEDFGGESVSNAQKLEDFIGLKKATAPMTDHESGASESGLDRSMGKELVEYDWISITDREGREIDYACYLLLPGGSCYGPRSPPSGLSGRYSTFAERAMQSQMRESAAEVALMNCIFNECPSRRITLEFVKQATDYAESVSVTPAHSYRGISLRADQDGCDGYRCVLQYCLDKTMMEYQELSNVLSLLSWSGFLAGMHRRGCARQDVLDYAASVTIDDAFRSELSMCVEDKEAEYGGFIEDELRQSEVELLEWRQAGKELRYPYEKRRICLFALEQYKYSYGGSESMYTVDDDDDHPEQC
ncbi:putative LIX1-like protein [Hypsibius exemplaris]|uniref:LIX1-like protein n=1 Tax=Hypsibius exemplaris TaxID=2072580 RepID=A0A1W0WQN1_HYPEX|nr:putative LIX1-like protein [Hypsibius exemplaris]